MNEQLAPPDAGRATQVREVLEERRVTAVFQPIFGFREGAILGYEALARGPEGSGLESPGDLFSAAHQAGLTLQLNRVCAREVLRAFAARDLEGSLFLNVSPQLITEGGFDQERARRYLASLGLEPARVVIELTEDYPTVDFRFVHESLMHYRALGFRVAIDDLGEGFASLRLWSELRPEFVKADKHFVAGIATDPVKHQFLRAIQHIAENSGSLVIAEGIENAQDFRVAKDIGIACGQGYFIGRPSEEPARRLTGEALLAYADARVPIAPAARLRPGTEPTAHDFVRAVDPVAPDATIAEVLRRFTARPGLTAIPVIDPSGVRGVVSRTQIEIVAASPEGARLLSRPCIEVADEAPIRVEADLDLTALTALLVESDSQHLADGFVIASRGRYLGMGTSQEVMRALQKSRVLAARYTNPLTMLPGQVPINEHLERLLASQVPFTCWYVEADQMRGLNDCEGYARGDALIHAVARLLEGACSTGVDFVGHVSGSRFVVLMQSDDWRPRTERVLAQFPAVVEAQVSAEVFARGYFIARTREGAEKVRPLPRIAIGILPVLPGVFESRHEVVLAAKHAAENALERPGSSYFVDEEHGNAYPQSLLFGDAE